MQRLAQIRINWRLKAILPVAVVLLAGVLAFVWLTFSFELQERQKVMLVAAGGALAICVVMLVILAVLIQRPLVELRQKISRLRDGDMTVKASFAAQNDEIGDLGRDFNEMVRQLRKSISDRVRAEEEVRTLNADLEERVKARTAELEVANKLKDDLFARERMAKVELEASPGTGNRDRLQNPADPTARSAARGRSRTSSGRADYPLPANRRRFLRLSPALG